VEPLTSDPQIPVLSALCHQLNLLNPPPVPPKNPGYATGHGSWKRTESCHNILFQSRSICDKNTSISAKAYGNDALNISNVFRWYSRFGDGRELVEHDKRVGHPKSTRTEVNIVFVADLVKNDCRIASRMIAESSNIRKTAVLRTLKEDLGKRRFFLVAR
jgi:hypothetical protein